MRALLHTTFAWLFCLGLAVPLLAQQAPVSGMWMGKLYQNFAPPFNEYRFRMEIQEADGKVTGITHISMMDSVEIFAEMEFSGTWDGNVMVFREVRVLDSRHLPNWSWCMKTARLRLRQTGEYYRLDGPWDGYTGSSQCTPGKIAVEKLNPQIKPQPVQPVVVEQDLGELEGRKIDHQRTVDVYQTEFVLEVYDADRVDGDVISLNYNGEWVLKDVPIVKTPQRIPILVEPGKENILILYAENEGKYPPNTAAVKFFDGKMERNLNLKSSKNTCGSLKFIYHPQ